MRTVSSDDRRNKPGRQHRFGRRLKPPLESPYRLLGVVPVRRSPICFGEDPRPWIIGEEETPDLLPSYRTLPRALRRAVGTVVYARQAFRPLYEPGLQRSWLDITPVAYRASLRELWVIDWQALDEVKRKRTRGIDIDWEEDLADEVQSFLTVMQFAHGRWKPNRLGLFAESLLGGSGGSITDLVDEAWVISTKDTGHSVPQSYEVAVGSRNAVLVGATIDYQEAGEMAAGAVESYRDELETKLALHGGLAAEVAACRQRWPWPRIHHVPRMRDPGDLDTLWREDERLRAELEENQQSKTDGSAPLGGDPDE